MKGVHGIVRDACGATLIAAVGIGTISSLDGVEIVFKDLTVVGE